MAWRTLHVASPARLSVRDNQVLVVQDRDETSLPIEDLAAVVLDTGQATLTARLLSVFASRGIALLVTDERHQPNGVLLPFRQHHAQAGVARDQAAISLPLKKRLWQRLVMAKIENQAAHLRERQATRAEALSAMARRVRSGDPDNLEAQAAREYWSELFEQFRRQAKDRANALIDYGYAIVRAALARATVSAGLLPAFGLHHDGRLNAFNLVDDLIEPYRPFVDRRARRWMEERTAPALDLDDRRHMAGILSEDGAIGPDRLTLLAATEATATSLVQAINSSAAERLRVPLLPLARRR